MVRLAIGLLRGGENDGKEVNQRQTMLDWVKADGYGKLKEEA